jgi:hypothetical protein
MTRRSASLLGIAAPVSDFERHCSPSFNPSCSPLSRLALSAFFALVAVACAEPGVPEADLKAPADAATAEPDTAENDVEAAPDVAQVIPKIELPTGEKALILAIAPATGPTGGFTDVEIAGLGFDITDQVFFGESPALEVQILDDNTLRAVSPPRPPGLVDIIVRLDDAVPAKGIEATEVKLPFAFRYMADVKLGSVHPKKGAVAGGTLVTVTGTGFTPKTQFVFGDRLGIDPLIVDENTAAVHSPPGVPGFVDVTAANSDGNATIHKAFTYSAPPQLHVVSPATATTNNGGIVTLHGSGLLAVGGVVTLLGKDGFNIKAQTAGGAPDAATLTVKLPPIPQPGLYGLRYASVHGYAELHDCVSYINAKPAESGVDSVSPSAVHANVQQKVAINVSGPIAGVANGKVTVTIDGSPCDVLDHNVSPGNKSATIVVLSPTSSAKDLPKKVGVHVKAGNIGAFAKDKITLLPIIPQIKGVTPYKLDPNGGTKTTIEVGPSPTAFGKLIGVRVGAMFASEVVWKHAKGTDTASIDITAPKGSPGPADVLVVFETGELFKSGGAAYAGQVPVLGALIPSRGSQAGGTWVQVIGSGLHLAKRLFIGAKEVKKFKLVHPGLIELRTPIGEPGAADLEVWFKQGLPKKVLQNAFTYFDPTSGNYGTWGPPIDGAVNVTVMQSNSPKGPLQGATVVVGTDPHTPHRGKTDARGQITFSAKIFKGPIMVSTTKAGYTAASVVAVNTENVTLRIRKHPVPSPGTPTPKTVEKLPDGVITGTVVNAVKYLQLPMGDCSNMPVVMGHCANCQTDNDCGAGTKCELLTDPLSGFNVGGDPGLGKPPDPPQEATLTGKPAQKFCTSACIANTECPTGFECRATSWQPGNTKFRCTPSIGKPEIRCETSSTSIYASTQPGPGSSVDVNHKFSIESRLGDLAVICRAGYIEKGSGQFRVLVMGVTPHVHVDSAKTTAGVKVNLSIPLNRRIRVRLDQIPMGEDAFDHRRELDVAIDLDPEGYIPMGEVSTTNLTDVLVLENQPSGFTGPLAGKPYTMYGGVRKLTGGSPVSLAMAENLHPENSDHIAFWANADSKPEKSTAMAIAVNDMASDGTSTYAVGDNGYLGVWSGQAFSQQSSPVAKDLHAVWALSGGGDAWAGGDGGVLMRRYEFGFKAMQSPTPLRIVDIAGNAKNEVWLLLDDNTMQRRVGAGWLEVDGPIAKAKAKTAWYQKDSDKLAVLFQAQDSALIAAGHNGGLWTAKPSDNSQILPWVKITTNTKYTIRALWGVSGKDFFFAGDRGYFGRYASSALNVFAQKTDRPLYAISGASDGVHAVGGLGAWVHLANDGTVSKRSVPKLYSDLRGLAEVAGGKVAAGQPVLLMGPYLEMPYFELPAKTDDLGAKIRWKAKPGVTPTLNLLRVTNYSYTTMWSLYVRGPVTEVQLPDFTKFGEISPLPGGQMRIRLWRIYAPGLDIDHFNHKQLSIWRWISYAYNWMLTKQVVSAVGDKPPAASPFGNDKPSIPPDFKPW